MDDAENAEEVNVESFDLKDYENVLNEEKWCVCCCVLSDSRFSTSTLLYRSLRSSHSLVSLLSIPQ